MTGVVGGNDGVVGGNDVGGVGMTGVVCGL